MILSGDDAAPQKNRWSLEREILLESLRLSSVIIVCGASRLHRSVRASVPVLFAAV
jgi:hypothetical protein